MTLKKSSQAEMLVTEVFNRQQCLSTSARPATTSILPYTLTDSEWRVKVETLATAPLLRSAPGRVEETAL